MPPPPTSALSLTLRASASSAFFTLELKGSGIATSIHSLAWESVSDEVLNNGYETLTGVTELVPANKEEEA